VPQQHAPSFATLSSESRIEARKYVDALRRFFASTGRALLLFERHVPLRHAHWEHALVQCVPVPASFADGMRERLLSYCASRSYGCQIVETSEVVSHAAGCVCVCVCVCERALALVLTLVAGGVAQRRSGVRAVHVVWLAGRQRSGCGVSESEGEAGRDGGRTLILF
jgi:hypothetical protein